MISPATWREVTATSVSLAHDLLQTVTAQQDFASVRNAVEAGLPHTHPRLLLGLNAGASWEGPAPAASAQLREVSQTWLVATEPGQRIHLLDQMLQDLLVTSTVSIRELLLWQVAAVAELGVEPKQLPQFARVVQKIAANPLFASALDVLLAQGRGWDVLARDIEQVDAIGTLDRLLAATLHDTSKEELAARSPVLTRCLTQARDMMGSNGWIYVAGRLLCAGVPLEAGQHHLMRTHCFQAVSGAKYTLVGALAISPGAFRESSRRAQVAETFEVLRQAGFDLDADDAGEGATALTLAMRESSFVAANVLIDFGCDPRVVPAEHRSIRNRYTALELAQQARVAAAGKANEQAAVDLYNAMRAAAAMAAAHDALSNNTVAPRAERIAMLDIAAPKRRSAGRTA